MEQQYTARVIEGNKYSGEKTTAEFTGTLQEIVDWAPSDWMIEFTRRAHDFVTPAGNPSGGWEWFTDWEPKYLVEEDKETFRAFKSVGLGCHHAEADQLHAQPMPLTVENVKGYVEYSEEAVSHFGQQWRVEITPSE